jgi:predicted type IV restriction endonuclease
MDFSEKVYNLSERIEKFLPKIQTEEATKQALILPFIQLLGFDTYDPMEVCPEFTTDIGIKKGEKVDYAILENNEPVILIECKWCGYDLNDLHHSQLYRYFSVTKAKIAILTNGIKYRFYTDLEETNKLDQSWFLEIDLLNLDEHLIPELKKLSKSQLNLDVLNNLASELKYVNEIKNYICKQFSSPDEEFTKFVGGKVYTRRFTEKTTQKFQTFTYKALRQFLNDEIEKRFNKVLEKESDEPSQNQNDISEKIVNNEISEPDEIPEYDPLIGKSDYQREDEKIITTKEELYGFHLIREMSVDIIDPDRLFYRDAQPYFAILLDDNNRKTVCRLYFNNLSALKLGCTNGDDFEKIDIDIVKDLKNYKSLILDRIKNLSS